MRKITMLARLLLCLSLSACGNETTTTAPKKPTAQPLDSMTFKWHSPGEWNYSSTDIGEKIMGILNDPEITKFNLSDGKEKFHFLKPNTPHADHLDFNDWNFKCFVLADTVQCFYVYGGYYPKVPPDDTTGVDLEFKLYLVE